jgi:hypothetical protein
MELPSIETEKTVGKGMVENIRASVLIMVNWDIYCTSKGTGSTTCLPNELSYAG